MIQPGALEPFQPDIQAKKELFWLQIVVSIPPYTNWIWSAPREDPAQRVLWQFSTCCN